MTIKEDVEVLKGEIYRLQKQKRSNLDMHNFFIERIRAVADTYNVSIQQYEREAEKFLLIANRLEERIEALERIVKYLEAGE